MISSDNSSLTIIQQSVLLIFLALLISLTGCTGLNRLFQEKILAPSGSSVYGQLEKAEKAMRKERYEEAKKHYESIIQAKARAPLVQQARYGLASISLLTADSLAQYREGLHAMQTWARNSTQNAVKEDPRYLIPLLEKQRRTLEALRECREDNQTNQKRITELEEARNATLSKLRVLRREREQLRQKIQKLENLYNELQETRKDL